MKFVTTAPMFLVPALVSHLPFYRSFKIFNRFLQMIINSILSNAVILLVATTANLYWVFPTELKIAPQGVLIQHGGIIQLITFVARLDVPQGIVDSFVPLTLAFILIPWILTLKFKRL